MNFRAIRGYIYDYSNHFLLTYQRQGHRGDVEGVVLFDVKEEGETNVALSHSLTEENL